MLIVAARHSQTAAFCLGVAAGACSFEDSFGKARIPLRQRFEVLSTELEARVDFRSELPQYFRAPVRLEKALQLRVFSDFRAVGIRTQVYLRDRISGEVLFDGEVRTQNALEYAYEPEVDLAEMRKWGLLTEA